MTLEEYAAQHPQQAQEVSEPQAEPFSLAVEPLREILTSGKHPFAILQALADKICGEGSKEAKAMEENIDSARCGNGLMLSIIQKQKKTLEKYLTSLDKQRERISQEITSLKREENEVYNAMSNHYHLRTDLAAALQFSIVGEFDPEKAKDLCGEDKTPAALGLMLGTLQEMEKRGGLDMAQQIEIANLKAHTLASMKIPALGGQKAPSEPENV